MKLSYLFLLLISFSTFGQIDVVKDEKYIYEEIVQRLIEPDKILINETIADFKKFDIDGNLEKWFYNKILSTYTISVEPIIYDKNVVDFLISKGKEFDIDHLLEQVDNQKIEYLEKYLTRDKIISYKRAPLRNSKLGNLFKKKEAYGFSNIIFEPQNNLAFVKVFHFSRNKEMHRKISQLVILEKIKNKWTIIEILDTKNLKFYNQNSAAANNI